MSVGKLREKTIVPFILLGLRGNGLMRCQAGRTGQRPHGFAEWCVRPGLGRGLSDLKSGPYEKTITGNNVIGIKDVLIGEVWLGSGQSNMAFTVAQATVLSIANTGMAVTRYRRSQLHPHNKQDLGDRLSRIALANVYGGRCTNR